MSAEYFSRRKSRRTLGIALIVLAIIISWLFSIRLGPVPSPGHFFNPRTGFWQNMESSGTTDLELVSDQLDSEVTVYYDERGVPHIFAENDHDLYFAQGFVTARDRLWQTDFQIRAAAGRLSEVVGAQTIDYDRTQRRMGMEYGAKVTTALLMDDPQIATIIDAYADGYNAWLDQLDPKDYPVEYKIMDAEPERFSSEYPALMIMNMAQTLTSGTRSHSRTNARALFDENIYDLLYPEKLPWVDPMIPAGQTRDFDPLPAENPDPDFVPQIIEDLPLPDRNPDIGSNSWAVDGSKTRSGYPLLASDPHLGVTLPSIWYEIQLNSDGINTYGVSLPAAPGVIIGFNEFCAWGMTNAGSHTLDVYEIEFRDEQQEEYLHDGEWKPVTRRLEEIFVRDGETVIDTVLYTHHGPIVQPADETVASERFPKGHAIQWTAHHPGNIVRSVYNYNRAGSHEEFEEAMRYFTNITQNITYADRDGNISIGHFGRFPVRFEGQGDYISDGRDPAYDWNEFIPFEHLPRSLNPDRGYVSTANQAPVTSDYPYYLGRDYAGFSRGVRINNLLEEAHDIHAGFFENMLMDDLSLYAEKMIPFLLSHLDRQHLTEDQMNLTGMLEEWDYHFDAGSQTAHFYKSWERKLYDELWDPVFEAYEGIHVVRPGRTVTFQLLLDDKHEVFPGDVTLAVNMAFQQTFDRFVEEHGDDPASWNYGRDRIMRINHLAQLDGFGNENVNTGGTPEAVNAVGTTHAPSWRMIVELGPEIRARGHYPGGQTGNPGHPGYNRMVDDWAVGSFHDLQFWKSTNEARGRASAKLILLPNY